MSYKFRLSAFRASLTAEQQEALGQQLVTRWNAHDELVAALTRCESLLSDLREGIETEGCAAEEILLDVRAALAKAGAL